MSNRERGRGISVFGRRVSGGVGLPMPHVETDGAALSASESRAPISTHIIMEKILAEEIDPEEVLALIAARGIAPEEHVG